MQSILLFLRILVFISLLIPVWLIFTALRRPKLQAAKNSSSQGLIEENPDSKLKEDRITAYLQLIQKLLQCPNGEEVQILNNNIELLDPDFLQTIIEVAEISDNNGNQNGVNFLTNLALQVGECLGREQQETSIRKQTADILLQWGIEQYYISRFMVAFECWKQCLSIYQAIQDRQGEANALGSLGIAYHSQEECERAITFHEESLAIKREIKDHQGEANSLGSLGLVYRSLGQYERAIDFHEQSLAISRELKYRQGEANALGNLGLVYRSLGQYEKAFSYYKQALPMFKEINDRQEEANCLQHFGAAYCYMEEYEKAITFHEQSLAISREIKYRQGEVNALRSLGNAYDYLGEYEKAITFHTQSLDIERKIKNRQGEVASLKNLGLAYNFIGQYEQAIALHKESLAISREIGYRQGEAASLVNLGLTYTSLGKYEKAIALYEQSLAIIRELKDRLGEATCLGNLGFAYLYIGQYERALDFSNQGLAISRELKNFHQEADCLISLGQAYYRLGEHQQAIFCAQLCYSISHKLKYRKYEVLSLLNSVHFMRENYQISIDLSERALAIIREIKYRELETLCLHYLGSAYLYLGKYERAVTFYEQSLTISHELKYPQGEAISLQGLGHAYRELQQPEKAIQNYRESLKIFTPETTMPSGCFEVGRNLGYTGFTQGDWQLALEGYEPAMQAVEQLRKGSTTDKRRQEIIAKAISVYANAVQCYINLKQYDKAVETADRSRSRHLADLFYSKDLYPQGEIPPEVAEYYRLQEQSNRLRISDNDGTKAFAATRQATPNSDATLKLIENLEAQKQQAWLKIRSKDPVLAGQLQADPLSFQQMQALIPDTETAIVNFYTTDKHTHVFILRQNQPPQLHTCEGQGFETLQNWIINNWLKPYLQNRTVWQSKMRDFLPELAQRLQLNQLIAEHLTGIKELIIIPHLNLHQIPFAALPLNNIPIPQSNTASDKTRGSSLDMSDNLDTSAELPPQQPEYLSDKFRLRIVPSCQILNYCHQRGTQKPATMGIVENATGDLVFTGYECETLANMYEVNPNNRLKYQQATISNYQNLLHEVNVLHSSHHAASNLNNSLESKLLLSDGDINLGRLFTWRFLQLAEVFLSCCETNLTLTPITDDPLSIAAGFLCAGARHVVSTLWAVDDLATALFCILYYQEKQDKSRSEAIRQAQFKLRNLTGDELYAKYKPQLEAYFEQQNWGENQAEIMYNVRSRLNFLRLETLPFVSPHYWSGFVSQGLA